MKVVVVGDNQKDREKVARAIKDKYGSLTEENAALLKKLQRSNDAWIRGQKEIITLKEERIKDSAVIFRQRETIESLIAQNQQWKKERGVL